MKRIMPLFLTFALLMMTATTGVFADEGNGFGNKNKQFKDIQGNWGQASILKMYELGLLQGYEDGTFRPDQTLTQDEVAVLLERIQQQRMSGVEEDADLEDDDDGTLKNVPGWAKKSVLKGVHHNYINLKRYHSAVQCDRLLAAVEIAKALGMTPVPADKFDDNPFNFHDRNLISDDDYGYLLALFNAGYLKGYPDGNFNPNYLMSRAQMAKMLDNIFNGDGEHSGDLEAPTWPTNSAITASGITDDSVTLNWSKATDNVGVTIYKISYKDTINKEKYANDARMLTVTGLSPEKEFTFTVNARDAAGNWSTSGPSVKATTLATTKTAITSISDITGIARVGEELTAGTLTPSGATATYQWLICDTVNGTYAAITTAALSRHYTPIDANVGKYLKVAVTGTGDFTGTVISPATLPIAEED